ncbi:bcl-2-related protein A1-like [Hydractinia symbiolongicarpus]|uniref:bcl-2-related protein A1-like n=1 Tax=Hydractinia symbiolongicarpus TaxID=13093 RepID=UPI00254B7DDC|nr:bcl-2-related protein A1-like [Hydractinia symbiolongicarpus]
MATVTLTPPTYSKRNHKISLKRNPEWVEVSDKAHAIATYYIPYHLRNSVEQKSLRGLPKSYLIPPQQPPELFTFIAKLCTHMEAKNSSFFTDLPERLNVRVDNSKTKFLGLCKETFADKVVNWGRVISIFTVAGCFALHFLKKNQLSTVQKIPLWVQEFIDQELADWIIEQGGWEDAGWLLSQKNCHNLFQLG